MTLRDVLNYMNVEDDTDSKSNSESAQGFLIQIKNVNIIRYFHVMIMNKTLFLFFNDINLHFKILFFIFKYL